MNTVCLIQIVENHLWLQIVFGNGAQKEENSSDKRKVFKTEGSEELGCRTPRIFAMERVVKDG